MRLLRHYRNEIPTIIKGIPYHATRAPSENGYLLTSSYLAIWWKLDIYVYIYAVSLIVYWLQYVAILYDILHIQYY